MGYWIDCWIIRLTDSLIEGIENEMTNEIPGDNLLVFFKNGV